MTPSQPQAATFKTEYLPRSAGTRSIEVSLLAPRNELVQVLGSFNNWQPREMSQSPDGNWRLQLELADGDYEYCFRVKSNSWFMREQWVQISDPRATRINPFSNEVAVLTVRNGHRVISEYEWLYDRAALPPDEELIIYELHVGGFGASEAESKRLGKFPDVISKLDYLCELGVNAIELMPIHEFPTDYSWGYNPRFHFAVESAYGTPADFKKLVDECHARGIRVILDVVFNHCDAEHPLAKIDHDYWFHHDNPDPEGVRFGPKFNYDYYDEARGVFPAREFSGDCARFWVEEYHVDGFRFDATALINNFDFLKGVRDDLKAKCADKPFILIAEHLPEDPRITGLDGPMDAAWHFTFHDQLKANLLGREFGGRKPHDLDGTMAVIDARREGFGGINNVVNFATSHDHEYEMMRLGAVGIFDEPAFRRAKHAAAMLLTSPGLPMLRMGEEFGEYAPKSLDEIKLHWELLHKHPNQDLFRHYSALIGLRKANGALRRGNAEFFFSDAERKLLVFARRDENGGLLVVVANLLDEEAGDFAIPNWPADGKWHEWMRDYEVEVQGGVLHDRLAKSEWKIFVHEPAAQTG